MPGPGERDWTVSIWFSLGKEAIDKLTSTTWLLAAAILSGFPLSLIISSVFWLPTSKSPLWATLIQLHASKGRSKGFFKRQCMGVLRDKAKADELKRGMLWAGLGETAPYSCLSVFTIAMVLLFCFESIFEEYHILIWLHHNSMSCHRLTSGSVHQFYISTNWSSSWFWRLIYSNIM